MKDNEVSHKSWHGAENLFEALRRQSPDIFIIGNICKGLTNTNHARAQVKRQWSRGSESIRSFSVIQIYSDHSAVLDLLTHTVAICSTDMTLAGNQFVASKAAKSSASAPNLAMAAWASWAAKTVVNPQCNSSAMCLLCGIGVHSLLEGTLQQAPRLQTNALQEKCQTFQTFRTRLDLGTASKILLIF